MTERRILPIIFSGPMVRALLADTKTQSRRLAWRTSGSLVGEGPAKKGYRVVYSNVGSTPVPLQYAPRGRNDRQTTRFEGDQRSALRVNVACISAGGTDRVGRDCQRQMADWRSAENGYSPR